MFKQRCRILDLAQIASIGPEIEIESIESHGVYP